ncbi:MAG: LysM peptidoglycan-binding domain-containing protein [Chloroflexi bacterium]|nr:LysM peptidoglycan-binding domain-containing protein [Chloroflexota bacterium]
MEGRREIGNAVVIALISIGLIVGALSISLVEFSPEVIPSPTFFLPPSPVPLTATQGLTKTPTPSSTPGESLPSFTPSPSSTSRCPVLPGWGSISVQATDTLDSIAARYRITPDELRRANCLFSTSLIPGSTIFVPPIVTTTSSVCIQGNTGWVKNYTVKPGDNLFRIAINHYTTLEMMRKVNCRTSDTIYSGDVLWVPNVSATRTTAPISSPGNTTTPYPTDPLTETPLPFTATFIPTPTNTSTPSATVNP